MNDNNESILFDSYKSMHRDSIYWVGIIGNDSIHILVSFISDVGRAFYFRQKHIEIYSQSRLAGNKKKDIYTFNLH